jgi:hypothetical protein
MYLPPRGTLPNFMPPIKVDRTFRNRGDVVGRVQELLTGPPTTETIERNLDGAAADLVRDAVWGSIRWPKDLGRPTGANAAAGFVVDCYVHVLLERKLPEGIETWAWMKLPPGAAIWEIVDPDPAFHAVAYWSPFAPAKCCVLKAELVEGVWPDAVARLRPKIEPVFGYLLPKGPERLRVPPAFQMSVRGRVFLDQQPVIGSGNCNDEPQ